MHVLTFFAEDETTARKVRFKRVLAIQTNLNLIFSEN